MVSEYGKTLRKIRIDKGLTMAQMAKAVGITSAYLSTIERGSRKIPKNLTQNVISHYKLSKEHVTELQKAEYLIMDSFEIELSDVDLDKKTLVFSIAKNLKNMTCEQVAMIKNIVEEN